MSNDKLNKFQRISIVKRLGLNTENSILITSASDSEIYKLQKFITTNSLSRVSIRTMPSDNRIQRLVPHYPIVMLENIIPTLDKIVSDNLYAIVATPIDPRYAELAGAVRKDTDTYTLELAKGPYTVRRVTNDGIIDINMIYYHRRGAYGVHGISDRKIEAILEECTKIPFSSCIVEVSYYSIPVGWREDNVVIWEITSDGSEESENEIYNFYHNIHE